MAGITSKGEIRERHVERPTPTPRQSTVARVVIPRREGVGCKRGNPAKPMSAVLVHVPPSPEPQSIWFVMHEPTTHTILAPKAVQVCDAVPVTLEVV